MILRFYPKFMARKTYVKMSNFGNENPGGKKNATPTFGKPTPIMGIAPTSTFSFTSTFGSSSSHLPNYSFKNLPITPKYTLKNGTDVPRKVKGFTNLIATQAQSMGLLVASETVNHEPVRPKSVRLSYNTQLSKLMGLVTFQIREKNANKKKRKLTITQTELLQKQKSALNEEKRMEADTSMPDPVCLWYSNEQNLEASKFFNALVKERKDKRRRAAVVLDLFSGIGGGTVVLKKLGIALHAVITVEHDSVAQLVHMINHYPKNNGKETTHFKYIRYFEDLNIDELLNEFGPIDLVIGGPPCVDFSGANANRQGVQGEMGSYILRFSEIVQEIKNHSLQKGEPVFFLCENVPISSNDGLEVIEEKIQTIGITVDSKYFSAAKRNRMFFTNIPPKKINWEQHESFSSQAFLPRDGWMHPSEVNLCGKPRAVKANTCMASKTRLDDARMIKEVRHLGGELYETATFDAHDRAQMLGYPDDYVYSPVVKIFQHEALRLQQQLKRNVNWEEDIEARTPWVNKCAMHLNADQYVKRLMGNGYSIPVVELLLSPLKKVFAEQEYPN